MTHGNNGAWMPRLASWLLFLTIALAPLPFGSTEITSIAIWCIALGACLILAPVRGLDGGRIALIGLAGLVVAAYGLVLHEQLAVHSWLAEAAPDPLWKQASAALGLALTPSASIARNQPWFALGRPLLCVLAAACGFLIGVDSGRARQLVKVIAWSGAVYAAYGIVAHVVDPTHILWIDKTSYLESVTGPFINRNTAGAYFGSCAVVWFLLFWEGLRRETSRGPFSWRAIAEHLFSRPPKGVVVAFAMWFLCLAAMFMTGSRGAAVLSLLALIVAFTVFFRRDLPGWTAIAAAVCGGGAVALLLLQVMGEGVNSRFGAQGLADEGRLETYRATWRMITDHPWFGTGQGTFAYAFPAYRSSGVSVWGVWDLAHNTLLEIAADMGLPIAVLVVIAWIVVFAVLIRGALKRRRGLLFPVAALAVAMLAVLHSLIDFSLQIPGYAVVVMSLVGVGLAQSFRQRQSQKPLKGAAMAADELGG